MCACTHAHLPCMLYDMSFSCVGFNSTLRRGNVTHHEYIQVGKGRDVGLNQISLFEAKVACGNGEQTLSRDIYRLGHRFDFFRMMSFYFSTIGFYVSAMVILAFSFFTFCFFLVLEYYCIYLFFYSSVKSSSNMFRNSFGELDLS